MTAAVTALPPKSTNFQECLGQLETIERDYQDWRDPLSLDLHKWIRRDEVNAQGKPVRGLLTASQGRDFSKGVGPKDLTALQKAVDRLREQILVNSVTGCRLFSNTPFIETSSDTTWEESQVTQHQRLNGPNAPGTFKAHEFARAMFAWLDNLPEEIYPFRSFRVQETDLPNVADDAGAICANKALYSLTIEMASIEKMVEEVTVAEAGHAQTVIDIQAKAVEDAKANHELQDQCRKAQVLRYEQLLEYSRGKLAQQCTEINDLKNRVFALQVLADHALITADQHAVHLCQLQGQIAALEDDKKQLVGKVGNLQNQVDDLADDGGCCIS